MILNLLLVGVQIRIGMLVRFSSKIKSCEHNAHQKKKQKLLFKCLLKSVWFGKKENGDMKKKYKE